MSVSRQAPPSGVILVIRSNVAEQAYTAALGAIRGGIDAVEITLTVPDALQVIERLRVEDVALGAGTVLTVEQAEASARAGAQFLVAPNTQEEVIATAHALGLPMVPGALTPTEVRRAQLLGADAVKVFPVNAVGGPAYIQDLRGPFPTVPFIVSGNVTIETATDYFAAGAVAVCVGRDILNPVDVAAGDVDGIARTTQLFMETVRAAVFSVH